MIQHRIKRGSQIISVALILCISWLIILNLDEAPLISSNKIPEVLRVNANTPIRNWKYICLHHSATAKGSAAKFDSWHRKRGMENGLAYHFVIGNGSITKDGEIEVGNRWKTQLHGGHVKDDAINDIAIGICLVGDFTRTDPSEKQVTALVDLIAKLMRTYKLPFSSVVRHQDIGQSVCPGSRFPWQEIRYRLEKEADL